jgi:hypothetical protein
MKKILFILMLTIGTHAFANCEVYIPNKYFHHDSGYSINFDFYKLLQPKGYVEVGDSSAPQVLLIEGQEITGRFHKAQARMSFGDIHIIQNVVCLTQWCGVSDYAKAFNKAYRRLSDQLPFCRK